MEGKGLQGQRGDALLGGAGWGGGGAWGSGMVGSQAGNPGPGCPLAELTSFLLHQPSLAEPSGAGSATLSGSSPINQILLS